MTMLSSFILPDMITQSIQRYSYHDELLSKERIEYTAQLISPVSMQLLRYYYSLL